MQVAGFSVLADISAGSRGARRQLGTQGCQQGLRNEGCHSARSYTSPGWEGRWSSVLSGRGAGEGRGSGCGRRWMPALPASSKPEAGGEAGGSHQGPTRPPRPLGTQSTVCWARCCGKRGLPLALRWAHPKNVSPSTFEGPPYGVGEGVGRGCQVWCCTEGSNQALKRLLGGTAVYPGSSGAS